MESSQSQNGQANTNDLDPNGVVKFEEFFVHHKNTGVFHPSFSGKSVVICLAISGVTSSIFMGALVAALLWFYSRQLKFLKNNLTKNSRNLQVMLFKALVAQMLVLFILVIIPFVIFCFHFIFPLRNGSFIASICLSIASCYPVCDIVAQFYFIKPFRKWITRKLKLKQRVSVAHIENVQVSWSKIFSR